MFVVCKIISIQKQSSNKSNFTDEDPNKRFCREVLLEEKAYFAHECYYIQTG